MKIHRNPKKAWLMSDRLKLSAYNKPLYVAARDAYDLMTSVQEIKPLSIKEHGQIIDALSKALLDIEE